MTVRQPDDLQTFVRVVRAGDVAGTRALLERSPAVREHIDDPLFEFGGRALHVAARNIPLLDVLLAAGADLGLSSVWPNGPYTVLDHADQASARFLMARGARLTANVAARLGWFDHLRPLVERDPSVVRARGGDGQQPLHQAATVEIADYLLDRGAEIDAQCIDHRSTPAQYALVDRPGVCRRLLERGARPDIFMAAALGDAPLAERLLDEVPSCVSARIGEAGYPLVPPFSIYCWTLGFGSSPHEVALTRGHQVVFDVLTRRSPARVRFLDAAMRGDEAGAVAAQREDPSLPASLGAAEHAQLARAIFQGRFAPAELMIRLGFDPVAPGQDGGTALHMACWMGQTALVDRLIALGVPLDGRDPTHDSPPIGWAAFGAVHRCAPDGDYVGVIERLVDAGADVTLRGNRTGATLIGMAEGRHDVQDALRRAQGPPPAP